MANQPETSTWQTGVYQLETADPVQGGVGGVSNAPLLSLSCRTRFLYDAVNALTSDLSGYAPLASPAFTGSPTCPTRAVGDNSGYLANTAYVVAGFLPLSGGTVTGNLLVNGTTSLGNGVSVTGIAGATLDFSAGRDVIASNNVTAGANVYTPGYVVVAGAITRNRPCEQVVLGASLGQGTVDCFQTTAGYSAANLGVAAPGIIIDFYYNGGNAGSIYTSGTSVAYNTTSDYRLKTNAQVLTGARAIVAAADAKTFEFVSDPGKSVMGFIAHELAAAVPGAVTGEKDATRAYENVVLNAAGEKIAGGVTQAAFVAGMAANPATYPVGSTWTATFTAPVWQQVDHSKLVPVLWAALRETSDDLGLANGKIALLEAQLAALTAQVAFLVSASHG